MATNVHRCSAILSIKPFLIMISVRLHVFHILQKIIISSSLHRKEHSKRILNYSDKVYRFNFGMYAFCIKCLYNAKFKWNTTYWELIHSTVIKILRFGMYRGVLRTCLLRVVHFRTRFCTSNWWFYPSQRTTVNYQKY